ncbi:MAG: AAA family ATPase [Moorellaceae bacterium]
MEVNPFNPYYPAPDHLFSNRSREQRFFQRGLHSGLAERGGGPWNIALLGPWGIGKTSLLRRFARIAGTEKVEGKAILAINVSATSAYSSFNEFARAFMRRFLDAVPRASFTREFEKWELFSVQVGTVTVRRKEEPPVEGAIEMLYRGLLSLWEESFSKKYAGVVVFIDDVQNLLEIHPKSLLALRTLFQDLQGTGARYPLVVTGPEILFGAVREVAEPVTRFFERMPILPFDQADTAEAVRHPLEAVGSNLKVEDEFVRKLYGKTLGHPYFIAFIMRDLVDAAYREGCDLTAELFDAHWESIIGHLEMEKFEEEWRACTPAERKVLAALARHPGAPVTKTFGKHRSLLGRLVDKGLVRRRERGAYEIYHPLFAEFVRSFV